MKKTLLLIATILFLLPISVNAARRFYFECPDGTEMRPGETKTCTLYAELTEGTTINEFTAEIIEKEATTVTNITAMDGWTLNSNENNIVNLTTASAKTGTLAIVSVTYMLNFDWQPDQECGITLKVLANPRRVCEYYNGKYYGKNGTEVTYEVYKAECEPPVVNPVCEYKDGKYYGKNGTEVTYEVYKAECEPPVVNPVCEYKDGKYYGKNGTEVTYEVYKAECEPPVNVPICVVKDGKYYGKGGVEVTYEVYRDQCEVENPNTGSLLPIALVSSIGLIAVALYLNLSTREKIYKLN